MPIAKDLYGDAEMVGIRGPTNTPDLGRKRWSFESFSQGGKTPQSVGTMTTANATRIIKFEIKQQN